MQIKRFDGINIIPFVDIMLVLLAIVLTTSTLIEKNLIPISLPKSSSQKTLNKKSITITINKDGKIYFEKESISIESLKEKLTSLDKKTPISINCDKSSKFESFVSVLDLLKGDDFKNISIITKAND